MGGCTWLSRTALMPNAMCTRHRPVTRGEEATAATTRPTTLPCSPSAGHGGGSEQNPCERRMARSAALRSSEASLLTSPALKQRSLFGRVGRRSVDTDQAVAHTDHPFARQGRPTKNRGRPAERRVSRACPEGCSSRSVPGRVVTIQLCGPVTLARCGHQQCSAGPYYRGGKRRRGRPGKRQRCHGARLRGIAPGNRWAVRPEAVTDVPRERR
jgi:hypothetical protein